MFSPDGTGADQTLCAASTRVQPVTCTPPLTTGCAPALAAQTTLWPPVPESRESSASGAVRVYVPAASSTRRSAVMAWLCARTSCCARARVRTGAPVDVPALASLPAGDTNTVAVVAATAGPDASGHAASAATAAAVAIAPPCLDRLTSSTFHEGASCVKERSDVCVGAEISLRPVGEVLYGLVRSDLSPDR